MNGEMIENYMLVSFELPKVIRQMQATKSPIITLSLLPPSTGKETFLFHLSQFLNQRIQPG